MNRIRVSHRFLIAGAFGAAFAACSSSGGNDSGSGGRSNGASGSAGALSGSSGSATGGSSGNAGTGLTGGTSGTTTGGASTGGTSGATGGSGGTPGSGGAQATGGSAGAGAGTSCTVGAWPAADPAVAGPFATTTEMNVGPEAGVGADGGAPVAFTMFRPTTLGQDGLCHPVVTWGNGTGSNPNLYRVFLNHLASHGFVIIASNSPQVSQGDPPPMLVGVTWVLEQNADPSSPLYGHIDATNVGATGHSQGGFATSTAAGDSRITTIAPLCGASTQRNLHGPAFIFCGGMDTTVPCDRVMGGYDSATQAMLANYLTADHANFITFRGTTPSPVEAAVTAWMRVHLMGDTSLRSWFYGPTCRLCTDPAWQIQQKMMDQ